MGRHYSTVPTEKKDFLMVLLNTFVVQGMEDVLKDEYQNRH